MTLKEAKLLWDVAFSQLTWAAFVALKLTGALPISWWWCLVPIGGCLVTGITLNLKLRAEE